MAFYNSKVGKLYVAQYDLTGFTTEMSPSSPRTLLDVTVFGDEGIKHLPGLSADKLSWSGLFDDGAAGSDVVMDALRSATAAKVVSVWPGDTTKGNRGYGSAEGWSVGPDIASRVGSRVEMSGELEMSRHDRIKSFEPKATKTVSYSDPPGIDDTGEALLTESGTVSGTETNGSADLDDTGAVFASTYRDGFHWVRLLDNTGRILSGYIDTADPDGDDTRVEIYAEHARTTHNWIEGGATSFDFADTPLTYGIYKQGFVFVYHIFAWSASGGNVRWKIEIQHSLKSSSFAGLSGSEAIITAAGAGRLSSTTELYKPYSYLNVTRDADSGSLTFFGAYERVT